MNTLAHRTSTLTLERTAVARARPPGTERQELPGRQPTEAPSRSNERWIEDLRADGPRQDTAVAELFTYLQRGLLAFMRQGRHGTLRRDPSDLHQSAQDFAQEALLKILERLDTFRGESRFLTWAMKIAIRTAISELRHAAYRGLSLDDLQERGAPLRLAAESPVQPAPLPDPEREAERREVLAALEQAIETELSEKQRAAFLATNVEGIPGEVVARLMDSNANAIYKLVHDARKKLRSFLLERGFTFEGTEQLFAPARS